MIRLVKFSFSTSGMCLGVKMQFTCENECLPTFYWFVNIKYVNYFFTHVNIIFLTNVI